MQIDDTSNTEATGSLRIERSYPAPVARVWQALTDPKEMRQWMCAPSREPSKKPLEADIRPGGSFRIPMMEDGHEVDAVGEYLEVREGEKLVLTWSWESDIPMETKDSRVEISLQAEGDTTRLTLIHSGFRSRGAHDGHRAGWTIALDALEVLVSS